MLQIPKKIDYAVQLLRHLNTMSEVVSLREVSDTLQLPFLFLQQIAQELKSFGYLESKRGAHGGYKLAKNIDSLTIQDVMTLFDERVETVACSTSDSACHKSDACDVKHIWKGVHHSLEQIFSSTYVLEK